jgi:hypothetical protein
MLGAMKVPAVEHLVSLDLAQRMVPVDTDALQAAVERLWAHLWLAQVKPRWSTRKGRSKRPSSLGWGTIQEQAFLETVANHPQEFRGVKWGSLIADHEMSMKVTAFRLRDLQTIAENRATVDMRGTYTPQEVAGAMYNIGTPNFSDAVKAGNLGPLGSSYAMSIRSNYSGANTIICQSGVWSCGG